MSFAFKVLFMLAFVSCRTMPVERVEIRLSANSVKPAQPFFVTAVLSDQVSNPPEAQDFEAVLRQGDCERRFTKQTYEYISGRTEAAVARDSQGRYVMNIPVIACDHPGGSSTIVAIVNRDGRRVSSAPSTVTVTSPDPAKTQEEEMILAECTTFSACESAFNYFQFVRSMTAADHLVRKLLAYSFYAPAADAVFHQGRKEDASALREAANDPNADSESLLHLAQRLESGNACTDR